MLVGQSTLKHSRGSVPTALRQGIWSGAVVFVVMAEILGLLAVLLGPSRFELSTRRLVAGIEWAIFCYGKFGPWTGASTKGAAPGSILQTLITLTKNGDTTEAETLFADDVVIDTRMNGQRLLPTSLPPLVAIHRDGVAHWLETVARYESIDADRVEERPGGVSETALVTTEQLKGVGIPTVQGVYDLTVQRGKITSVVATYAPGTGTQIGAQSLLGRPIFGFSMIVAAVTLPCGLLLVVPGRQRFRLALLLVGVPLLAAALTIIATLDDPQYGPIGQVVPGAILFQVHALLGSILNLLDGSPLAAALQWIKAASHAGSPAEVDQAAQGIAVAVQRSRGDPDVMAAVCTAFDHGSPSVQDAVARAGINWKAC